MNALIAEEQARQAEHDRLAKVYAEQNAPDYAGAAHRANETGQRLLRLVALLKAAGSPGIRVIPSPIWWRRERGWELSGDWWITPKGTVFYSRHIDPSDSSQSAGAHIEKLGNASNFSAVVATHRQWFDAWNRSESLICDSIDAAIIRICARCRLDWNARI